MESAAPPSPATEGAKGAMEQLWIFFSVYDYFNLKPSPSIAEKNAVRQMCAAMRMITTKHGGASSIFTVLDLIMHSFILAGQHPLHWEVLSAWAPRTFWRCSWWRPSPCRAGLCRCWKEQLKKEKKVEKSWKIFGKILLKIVRNKI